MNVNRKIVASIFTKPLTDTSLINSINEIEREKSDKNKVESYVALTKEMIADPNANVTLDAKVKLISCLLKTYKLIDRSNLTAETHQLKKQIVSLWSVIKPHLEDNPKFAKVFPELNNFAELIKKSITPPPKPKSRPKSKPPVTKKKPPIGKDAELAALRKRGLVKKEIKEVETSILKAIEAEIAQSLFEVQPPERKSGGIDYIKFEYPVLPEKEGRGPTGPIFEALEQYKSGSKVAELIRKDFLENQCGEIYGDKDTLPLILQVLADSVDKEDANQFANKVAQLTAAAQSVTKNEELNQKVVSAVIVRPYDESGNTVMHHITGNETIASLFDMDKILGNILDVIGDEQLITEMVAKQNKEGATPLSIAAQVGKDAPIRTMLERADETRIVDLSCGPFGWTPLHCAIAAGNANAVDALISGGANPLIPYLDSDTREQITDMEDLIKIMDDGDWSPDNINKFLDLGHGWPCPFYAAASRKIDADCVHQVFESSADGLRSDDDNKDLQALVAGPAQQTLLVTAVFSKKKATFKKVVEFYDKCPKKEELDSILAVVDNIYSRKKVDERPSRSMFRSINKKFGTEFGIVGGENIMSSKKFKAPPVEYRQ